MLVRGILASITRKRLAHPVYDFPVCAVSAPPFPVPFSVVSSFRARRQVPLAPCFSPRMFLAVTSFSSCVKGRSAGSLLTLEGSCRGAVTVAGEKGQVAAGHRPTPSPVDRW